MLAAVRSLGGSATNKEIREEVASAIALPEVRLEVRYEHSGDLVFRDRVNWALTWLRERGLLANPRRGVWEITEDGAAVHDADALVEKKPVRPQPSTVGSRTWATAGVPKQKELMLPTLEAMKRLGEPASIADIDRAVADHLSLSDEVLDVYAYNGVQTAFEYNMAWARTYLKNEGLVERTGRGIWAVTELGESADEDHLADVLRKRKRGRRPPPSAKMASVPKPKDLMAPTLEAMKRFGQPAPIADIDRAVADHLSLSDEVLDVQASNGVGTAFEYNMAWARTNLKKASLVENPRRGVWALTESGEGVDGADDLKDSLARAAQRERRPPGVAVSHRERVGRAMDSLRQGLGPFIEREVRERVNRGVVQMRTIRRHAGDPKAAERPLAEWDAAALLKVMWEAWNEVFRFTLGRAERSLVQELRDWRNKWAHQERFSSDDAYRVLDSSARLLAAVSAPEAATVEESKAELLRSWYDGVAETMASGDRSRSGASSGTVRRPRRLARTRHPVRPRRTRPEEERQPSATQPSPDLAAEQEHMATEPPVEETDRSQGSPSLPDPTLLESSAAELAPSPGPASPPMEPTVVLGHDRVTADRVEWTLTVKGNPHLLVAGLPGMGKTSCLLNLCRQMLDADVRPIVFSYHQDLDEKLDGMMDSIRFVDFDGLGFNPLQIPDRPARWPHLEVAGMMRDIFTAIFPRLGDLQAEAVRNAVKDSFVEEGWAEPGADTARLVEPAFKRFYEILAEREKSNRRLENLLARLDELNDYGLFGVGQVHGSLWESSKPTVIRIHRTQSDVLQNAFSSLVLYGLYKDMFRRGIQDRVTHAVIFDEAHRAAKLKVIPTMAKECRKYGVSLVLASQEARDFHKSVFSAIANYLVLRLTDADAKTLVKTVAVSRHEKTLIDEIKQMNPFRALYFQVGKARPNRVDLQDPEDGSRLDSGI